MIANAQEVQRWYESGLQGARFNQAEYDALMAELPQREFSAVAHSNQFADAFKGRLVAPFVEVEKRYPGIWPGAAQQRGDCESHSLKNGIAVAVVGDVVGGAVDPVSGKYERCPEIPQAGIEQGAFSSEVLYWFSGCGNRKNYRGEYVEDGWSAAEGCRVMIKKAGAVVRAKLGETGIDLTHYSADLAGKYGDGGMPPGVADAIDNNLIQTCAEAHSFDEIRDALGNYFGVVSDGSESFSVTRDANGVSKRTAEGWGHAMAIIATDDRPETIALYGEPLVLILNSWGRWNKGPRVIRGTNTQIPEGAFWARWSDVRNRRYFVLSGVNGWQRPRLKDYAPDWGLAT